MNKPPQADINYGIGKGLQPVITPIQVPEYIRGLHTRVPKQARKITVMSWLKANGEFVADGDPVVVLDTRKAAVEMAAQASGLLFHLRSVNEKVKVGDILGVVADSVEEFEQYCKH
ncbi:hypothetical protein SBDP1_870015 [Syntrophobacter sp. SbD1]|nr:hypothetical protein SBDP1_870015 [Syntrophobacter sp. SbD1]